MELVTVDGGLTGLGYALCIALAIIALAVAAFFNGRRGGSRFNAKNLAICGAALALGFVLSYVKVIPLPFGGSVTLCSMLFISLVGYWYGLGTGLLIGFVYGIMQFLQGPYVLSLFQVGCDYIFAFTCLGLSGAFANKKNGLMIGYIVSILARGAFHSLGGYLFWMEYMPEDFPTAIAWAYPIVYNYGYILAEGIITVIILLLPPVKKGLAEVTRLARG